MSKHEIETRLHILEELIYYGIATKKDVEEHTRLQKELAWIEYQEDYNGY